MRQSGAQRLSAGGASEDADDGGVAVDLFHVLEDEGRLFAEIVEGFEEGEWCDVAVAAEFFGVRGLVSGRLGRVRRSCRARPRR